MRMAAWGQTMAHLPQSMQMDWVPDGDLLRDGALLPLGGGRREGAVDRHGTDGQQVALAGHDSGRDVLDEVGRLVRHERGHARIVGDRAGRHLVEPLQREVDGREVALHDLLAALAVGLLHEGLDGGDGLRLRQDAGELEEAGLHHGVDAVAHAHLVGHGKGIDDVELDVLLDDLLLHRAGQLLPDLVGGHRAS